MWIKKNKNDETGIYAKVEEILFTYESCGV